MSYDIELLNPVTRKVLELESPHHMRGGTFQVGGSTQAALNVTYNYAPHFEKVLGDDGIRTIYGKSGADSIPLLETAISKLGDEVDDNYWKPTDGNAKRSLYQLLAIAKMLPYGIWSGD